MSEHAEDMSTSVRIADDVYEKLKETTTRLRISRTQGATIAVMEWLDRKEDTNHVSWKDKAFLEALQTANEAYKNEITVLLEALKRERDNVDRERANCDRLLEYIETHSKQNVNDEPTE